MKDYYLAHYSEEAIPLKLFGCETEDKAKAYAIRLRPNQTLIKLERVNDDNDL